MRSSRTICLAFAFLALSATMYANPVSFTETTIGSGSLNGVSFTGQLITLSGTGDTTSVVNSPYFELNLGSATVTIGNGSAATFTGTVNIFANGNAAGFESGFSAPDILDTFAAALAGYNLQSSINVAGSPTENSFDSFGTSLGSFNLASTTGSSTFSANVSSTVGTGVTPEPSAMTLVGSGALGLVGLLRRRLSCA